MEALLAVGLAGNVVQFAQFTGQLISEANSIRKSGSPSSLPDLRNLSQTLKNHAGVIKSRLKATAATLAQEDQYLLDIASECEEAGTEFLDYLDDLTSKSTSSNRFRAAKASIKFQWVHHKIENFASKLDKLRGALILGTMVSFRASMNANNEEVLEHLQEIHTTGAIHSSESAKTLEAIHLLGEIVQARVGQKLDTIECQVQERVKEIQNLRSELSHEPERDILRWLHFRQMQWRHDEVPLAYQKTFDWIFQKPREMDGWDDFAGYLSAKDIAAPFFINGKAGSGKSTLMKFIINDSRMMTALSQWSGREELLVVHSFFWNLGTSLQKSNVGMLRALMHSVLERYPELIPAVFPSLYQNRKKDLLANIEPTYTEVKSAFELLLKKSANFLKLCFVIDGIDELEGDHKDMAQFLRPLVSSQVKIIASSRPINACLNAFEGCPSLRLQDLTKNDMAIFVEDNLVLHQSMAELTELYPDEAGDLVSEIRNKAEGVFLWVTIVVRLLVDGLEDGDDINDLRKKLRSLPPNLRDLYRRMIAKLHPEHQRQAAEIFQLFHTWNNSMRDRPFRTLTLSFAVQSPSEAFQRQVARLTPEALRWLRRNLEARMRSRCCGLLEAHKKPHEYSPWESSEMPPDHSSAEETSDSMITYLHRTVAEFLLSEDVWDDICGITAGSEFDPNVSLASACLSLLKAANSYFKPDLVSKVTDLTTFLRKANSLSDSRLERYIIELGLTMRHHQSLCGARPYRHWSADFYPVKNRRGESPFKDQGILDFTSTFTFAARTGLVQYLRAFIDLEAYSDLQRYAMGVHALESWVDCWSLSKNEQDIALKDRSDTLLFLLQNVIKPEDEGLDGSLWHYAVTIFYELVTDAEIALECVELLRILLVTARSPGELGSGTIMGESPRVLIGSLRVHENPEISRGCDELEQSYLPNSSAGFKNSVTDRPYLTGPPPLHSPTIPQPWGEQHSKYTSSYLSQIRADWTQGQGAVNATPGYPPGIHMMQSTQLSPNPSSYGPGAHGFHNANSIHYTPHPQHFDHCGGASRVATHPVRLDQVSSAGFHHPDRVSDPSNSYYPPSSRHIPLLFNAIGS